MEVSRKKRNQEQIDNWVEDVDNDDTLDDNDVFVASTPQHADVEDDLANKNKKTKDGFKFQTYGEMLELFYTGYGSRGGRCK